MDELNTFIAGMINSFSISMITERSWFEIASILAPSVILILVLFGFSFLLQNRNGKIATYIICLLLILLFLPYELYRQATTLSKAQANVAETESSLKTLLNASDLDHLENLVNQEVASGILDEAIDRLSQQEKKELILISWLIAENEKRSRQHHEDQQAALTKAIQLHLDQAKQEIISTREPVDKISADILQRIEDDVSRLIAEKMQPFSQAIEGSLDSFQENIQQFMQNELNTYEETLTSLTQKGIEELGNALKHHTYRAQRKFTQQIRQANEESAQKLNEAQRNIAQLNSTIEEINLEKIIEQIKQLSDSINIIQKQNDIRFEYHECIRSAGLIDLIGKEEECRKKLNNDTNDLINP